MPTYEYLCKSCGHRFEIWQKMTDDALKVCPECGATIRRVVFPAGIVFKGSGFYKTDHGNGAVAAAAEAGHSTKSEDGTSSETKKSEKTEKSEKSESGERKSESKSGADSSASKPSESKVAAETK